MDNKNNLFLFIFYFILSWNLYKYVQCTYLSTILSIYYNL